MNRFVLPATALAAVALVAGCTYQQAYPGRSYQEQRSPAAMADLARSLNGRIAGRPQDCLSRFAARDMRVIDDNAILYRDGTTTYLNEPPGGCPGLGRPGNAMVTRSSSSELCRGEIIQIIDTSSGIFNGSCTLGEFVPYRMAGR